MLGRMRVSLQDQVAAEIRAELARQRITQGRLAIMLGRSEAYTTRRLKGEVAFDLSDIQLIADLLGVPVSKFMPAAQPEVA